MGAVLKSIFLVASTLPRSETLRKEVPFKNKLVSLDSTVIDLCISIFDSAQFRRIKGAIKLHLVLDHDGYLPCFGVVTEGKVNDVKVAHTLYFEPGTVVWMIGAITTTACLLGGANRCPWKARSPIDGD